jgi:hypothetical protein
MGWTSLSKPAGMSTREVFEREFNFSREGGDQKGTVLDCSVKGNVAYLAYERMTPTHRYVYAIVCLIRRSRKDTFNFSYKDMDETMGPYYYDCPARILSLLTPTDNEEARQWREKCWKRSFRRMPEVGETVEFGEPIKFTDGTEHSTFRYAGGSLFYRDAPNGYASNYRITHWREREFKVLPQV